MLVFDGTGKTYCSDTLVICLIYEPFKLILYCVYIKSYNKIVHGHTDHEFSSTTRNEQPNIHCIKCWYCMSYQNVDLYSVSIKATDKFEQIKYN